MPDPRVEAAVEARENANAATLRAEGELDALRARLAEAEHDATSSASAVARLHELLADAVTRAETAEAACETSGAALVVMNDLLKEAEAARDALTEALEKIRDAPQPESGWRIARAALAAVKGREGQATFSRCGGVGRCLCDTDDSSRCFEGREDA